MPVVRKPLDLSRVTELDLAYAAGIVDGEGCLTIIRQKYKNGYPENYWPRVEVGTVDDTICPWLFATFGGALDDHLVTYKGNKIRTWRWSASHAQLYDFLTAVRPYLKLKRAIADVLFEYKTTIRVPGKNITEETRAFRKVLYDKVKTLRAKARKAT